MAPSDNEAELRERIAALEKDIEYLSRAVRDVPEIAAASGRQGAISYEEGLRASFVADTKERLKSLRRVELAVVGLGITVGALATVIGVKLNVFVP